MIKVKEILYKPYPRDWDITPIYIIKVNVFIGVFVTLFLFLFKPSTILNVDVDFNFFQSFIYGFISFLVPTILMRYIPLVYPKFVIEENWNIGKEFLLNVSIIILIAFSIILYAMFFLDYSFEMETAIRVFWLSFLIGVVPTFAIILFNQNRLLKNYVNSSIEINESLIEKENVKVPRKTDTIKIIGEGKNDYLSLSISQFLYASSQSNYCEIFYLNEASIEKKLIRISLTNLLDHFKEFDNIEKVHRSYITNLLKVTNVTGNAQGYKLHFNLSKETVPVSRKLSKEIKNKIILI